MSYVGPGVFFGIVIMSPVTAKRSAFPKEYIGWDSSSAKINFPNDVYERFFIASSWSLSNFFFLKLYIMINFTT